MAWGIETRLPFLDYRLAAKVLPISIERKMQGGRNKGLLRAVLKNIVPDKILERNAKTGYPAPMSQWLKCPNPKIREQWFTSIAETPFIDVAKFHANYKAFIEGENKKLPAVWRAIILSMWYRNFFVKPLI